MTDWRESANKRRDYRRGGQEPDPPKSGKHNRKKPFVLQGMTFTSVWLKRGVWLRYGRYSTFVGAMQACKQAQRGRYGLSILFSKFRIVDTRTDEVVFSWESEDDSGGACSKAGDGLLQSL